MNHKHRTTLILLGLTIAVLGVLASVLNQVELQPGQPIPFNLFRPFAFGRDQGATGQTDVPGWVPLALLLGAIGATIGLIVSPRLRRELMRNLPLYLLFALGVYLIGSSLRSSTAGGLAPVTVEPLAQQQTPDNGSAQLQAIPTPPDWLVSGFTVLLILVLLGVAFVLVRRMLQRKPAPIDRIIDEAREALDELRGGANLRDTISRCYAEMVRILGEQRGLARDTSLTPREFELRLAALGINDRHIRQLTRLFEQVRYSPHHPGPKEEQEAQACLEAIVQSRGQ